VQFNLQSRLEAARDERRRQAAFLSGQAPPADPTDRFSPPTTPAVIDLRTIRSMRATANHSADAPTDTPAWTGSPRSSVMLVLQSQAALREEAVPTTNPVQEPCPGCGGSVRLDMFDLVTSVAQMTCLDCGLLFSARSPNA
jgi:hypothetical protein